MSSRARSNDTIDGLLKEQLSEIPRILLTKLVQEKLNKLGIEGDTATIGILLIAYWFQKAEVS
jgi:hypothetical protein